MQRLVYYYTLLTNLPKFGNFDNEQKKMETFEMILIHMTWPKIINFAIAGSIIQVDTDFMLKVFCNKQLNIKRISINY